MPLKKPLMDPRKEEKGHRCRLAILVLQNVNLDRVFRQIIEDYGLTDEELMSSIDYLYGKLEEYLTKTKKQKKRPRMVNRKRANPEGRKRTKCQLCPLSVVHMLRHVMSTHGLSRQEAKQAKVQEGHAMRIFHVEGCHAVVKRLDKHLKNVHKLVGGTTEYAASLKTKNR
uniref:Uncharacterized protein LOC111116485 n=1 Tax=Crassostrea virginica TaxID=6565 RepID=A0A8B8C7V0_CRAVI|nr:uncharacterized protein LOC111116485 [Crassostrea virginica]